MNITKFDDQMIFDSLESPLMHLKMKEIQTPYIFVI